MKRFSIFATLLLCSTMFFLSSCSGTDDFIEGCTDSDAYNHNPDAEVNDGSCLYRGKIVFWYSQSTAQFLINDGATAMKFYLDGELVGSAAASIYFTSAPSCDQSMTVTKEKDLGSSKSKSFSYRVTDENGFEYWSGDVEIEAGSCLAFELPI